MRESAGVAEMLEILLEFLLNAVEIAVRWRLFLCLSIGAIVTCLVESRIENPKLSLALTVCTLTTAVLSGIGWEIWSRW